MDCTQDYITIGRILILRGMRDMKKDDVDLNKVNYDKLIEELYRDLENPEMFPREGLLTKHKKLEMDDYSRKTLEKLR